MATDLKTRPPDDKEDNPVQKSMDKEFEKLTSPEHMAKNGRNSSSEINKEKNKDAQTGDKVDLKGAENNTAGNGDRADDFYSSDEKNFTRENKRSAFTILRNLSGKQKGIIGGTGGVVVALIIFLFPIIMGPLQFVHISQILLPNFDLSNETGDISSSRLIRRLWHGNAPEKARLGFIGNRAANKIQTRLEADGITIQKTAAGYMESITVKGEKIFISDLDTPRARDYRVAFRKALKSRGYGKIATAIMSRPMFLRYGVDFKWLGNVKRTIGEKLNPFKQRVREDTQSRVADGVDDLRVGSYEDSKNELERQLADAEATSDTDRANAIRQDLDALEAGRGDVSDVAQNRETIREDLKPTDGSGRPDIKGAKTKFADRLKNVGGKGTAIGAAIGMSVCFTRTIAKQAPKLEYLNKWQPSIRMGMRMISIGFQVMTGQEVDGDELEVVAESFVDAEGRSWAADKQMNKLATGKFAGVDTPPDIEIGAAAESGWVQAGEVLDLPLVDGACSALGNIFVQGALAAGEFILTGWNPLGWARIAAVEGAQDAFSRLLLGPLGESIIRSIAGLEISTDASGPRAGAIWAQGASFAAVETGRMLGGTSLSPAQAAAVQRYVEENNPERFAQKSFYDKFINPKEPGSVVGSFAMASYVAVGDGAVVNFNPINLLSSLFSQIGSLFTGKIFAGSDSLPSGVPPVGFTAEELAYMETVDPFALADRLFDKYGGEEELDATFGECLSENPSLDPNADIDSEYYLVKIKPECADGSDVNQADLLDYRLYRYVFEPTLLALGCYSDDQSSCTELGLSSASTNSNASRIGNTPSSGTVSGTTQELTQQILDNEASGGGITFQRRGGIFDQKELTFIPLSNGEQAAVSAINTTITSTDVSPELLRILLQANADGINFQILGVTTRKHGDDSTHYIGRAADILKNDTLYKYLYDNSTYRGGNFCIGSLIHMGKVSGLAVGELNLLEGRPGNKNAGGHETWIHVSVTTDEIGGCL